MTTNRRNPIKTMGMSSAPPQGKDHSARLQRLGSPISCAAAPCEHNPPIATDKNAAVELIRRKLDAIYGNDEPDAKEEIAEVRQEPAKTRSKHQEFMYHLSTSGKSLAQIQTAWHDYYVNLSDTEKHEVWHEFYDNNAQQQSAYNSYVQQQATTAPAQPQAHTEYPHKPKVVVAEHTPPTMPHSNRRSVARIKKRIVSKVLASSSAQEKAKEHLKSLAFGLSTGLIVLVVFCLASLMRCLLHRLSNPAVM